MNYVKLPFCVKNWIEVMYVQLVQRYVFNFVILEFYWLCISDALFD